MAKEALYFSHDSNARHDPKMTAMRSVYGSEGYGWFWMLVEMMREADEYQLDMTSKYAFHAYAMQLQCESDAFASFVHDCINEFDLFKSDGVTFWSESLLKRMKIKAEKSEKAKQSAEARWKKGDKNANASKSNANASKNDAYKKGKEINESKGNETKEETSGSLDPFRLFESEGFGTPSSIIIENINDMVKTYTEVWVCEAMKVAVMKNKRSLSFVHGVLKNWKADGIDDPWNGGKNNEKSKGLQSNGNDGKGEETTERVGWLASKYNTDEPQYMSKVSGQ